MKEFYFDKRFDQLDVEINGETTTCTIFVKGSMSVSVEENWGASSDGHRGVRQIFITEPDFSSIVARVYDVWDKHVGDFEVEFSKLDKHAQNYVIGCIQQEAVDSVE